jgi:hypothetical protein
MRHACAARRFSEPYAMLILFGKLGLAVAMGLVILALL